MRRVLMVIDMQNDFVAEVGALSFPEARQVIPFVTAKVKEALARGYEVLFTLDTHTPGDLEFNKFPPHCLADTPGQELIPELQQIVNDELKTDRIHLVRKNRYSAFHGTELDQLLGLSPGSSKEKVAEVELVGVCTNICCFFTAEELANRDVPVTAYQEGMASFDQTAHQYALEQMKSVLGVKVV